MADELFVQLRNALLDVSRQLQSQVKNDFPNGGYRRVASQLRYQGIKVPQSRVREALQRVDPEGVAQR